MGVGRLGRARLSRGERQRQIEEVTVLDPEHYEAIAIDKRSDGIALATLNRPERLNAVNGMMHHELSTLTRDADADPDVRVLVVTGAGRAFCAGGDFGPQRGPGGP